MSGVCAPRPQVHGCRQGVSGGGGSVRPPGTPRTSPLSTPRPPPLKPTRAAPPRAGQSSLGHPQECPCHPLTCRAPPTPAAVPGQP